MKDIRWIFAVNFSSYIINVNVVCLKKSEVNASEFQEHIKLLFFLLTIFEDICFGCTGIYQRNISSKPKCNFEVHSSDLQQSLKIYVSYDVMYPLLTF